MSYKYLVIYYGTAFFDLGHVLAHEKEVTLSFFLENPSSLNNPSGSEHLIGTVQAAAKGFTISRKVFFPGQSSKCNLAKEATRKSIDRSLETLGVDRYSLSKFPAETVERFIAICERKGHAKPSAKQRQDNLTVFRPEREHDPLLCKHNVVFDAYSQLCERDSILL
ncbi:aldo/keto reductase [Apiospora phragmitis]|uniref:Aldo/keto reductase n=1 Tax=Apiospora phragmitis TaxID=2905665 RepID=A0ABR1UH81_9PEZI